MTYRERRRARRTGRLRDETTEGPAAEEKRELDPAETADRNAPGNGVLLLQDAHPDLPEKEAYRRRAPSKGQPRKVATHVAHPPLDIPYEPPEPRKSPHGDRIDAVSQRIAGVERRGEFRCDAVTHTLVVMLFRQVELATGAPHGCSLHPGQSDEELANAFGWGLERLRWIHGPSLFPEQPVWNPKHLRAWVVLWHGVDMIGRYGRLTNDVVAETFQFSASTTGKQKALGSYSTPFNVCLLMATMLAGDEPWNDTLMEPCVGAGSMIVAMWEVVREKLIEAQHAGRITADEAHALVRKWVAGVKATDIDAEAAWTASAQLAVRTGCPVRGAPHPYRFTARRSGLGEGR